MLTKLLKLRGVKTLSNKTQVTQKHMPRTGSMILSMDLDGVPNRLLLHHVQQSRHLLALPFLACLVGILAMPVGYGDRACRIFPLVIMARITALKTKILFKLKLIKT